MNGIMRDLDTGAWAQIVPERCPCNGHGWLLSDFDTWHVCPLHGKGVPHPEDDESRAAFDVAAHRVRIHREAWRALVAISGMTPKEFRAAVEAGAHFFRYNPIPRDWVYLAAELTDRLVNAKQKSDEDVAELDNHRDGWRSESPWWH